MQACTEKRSQGPEQAGEHSISFGFVTGHDFSRADKANKMNRALAPAKGYSSQRLEIGPFFRSLKLFGLQRAFCGTSEGAPRQRF